MYTIPSEHELSRCVNRQLQVNCFFNQGVTPLLAPTFTSHLNLRLLETLRQTNSGYATVSSYYVQAVRTETRSKRQFGFN